MWFPQGTCREETGYFPASYVQMISPGNQVFQALYDLTPEAPGDLQLTEGQVSVRECEREREREGVCVRECVCLACTTQQSDMQLMDGWMDGMCVCERERESVCACERERECVHCKNERSFQPFLGYLSCFCSCFYNSSH